MCLVDETYYGGVIILGGSRGYHYFFPLVFPVLLTHEEIKFQLLVIYNKSTVALTSPGTDTCLGNLFVDSMMHGKSWFVYFNFRLIVIRRRRGLMKALYHRK
jgi:hypothetical protein